MSKSILFKLLLVLGLVGFSGAVVYAAISEKGTVKGTTFKVASNFTEQPAPTPVNSSLKILSSHNGGTVDANLVDSLTGPIYQDINPTWIAYYPVKFYNKSDQALTIVASADYIEDPNTIRDDLYVAIYEWNDVDNDGMYDDGEEGPLYKRDTILRLKNDTFNLGQIAGKTVKNIVLKFDGSGLSSANYSNQGIFDFVFTGTTAQ